MPRLSSREKLNLLGAVTVLLLTAGYVITRFPAVQKRLIFYEHRTLPMGWAPDLYRGGWGWAERRQLHSPELGPELLRDPLIVKQRHQQLTISLREPDRFAGEWALVFAAKRLQGMTNEQILAGEEGLTLTLATLVAEADPPAWWNRSSWLKQQTAAKPLGSFRMGLLTAADVERLMARLPECQKAQLSCLVRCVLRHEDGFTPSQRDAVLAAWAKVQDSKDGNANSVASLQASLEARQGLTQLLMEVAPLGSEVSLQTTLPERTSALERKRLNLLLSDFVRSLGYRPKLADHGAQVSVMIELRPVSFQSITVDHYKTYTETERVSHRKYSKVGGFQTVWEDRPVIRNERQSQTGSADIISLCLTAQTGDRGVALILPPYGEVRQDSQARTAAYMADESNADRFYWSYYLEHDASRPWRYGLEAFHHNWELEDFP